MSETHSFHRALRIDYRGHKHKLHLIVLEDCDADEHGQPCEAVATGEENGDALFEVIMKALNFAPEITQ